MKSFEPLKELLDDSSTFYLISVGMDSTYRYINRLYQPVFKPQHGNLLGKHYAVTMHPEDTGLCRHVAGQCFENPEGIFPAVVRKHDGCGGYIATQWDYKAMLDERGEPSGIFCLGYDITTLVQKTNALEQIEHIQSHVIRKPIANLQGLVELFDERGLGPQQKQLLSLIRSCINELDVVVSARGSDS
ncbi:MAG: hypothetical protein EOP49_10700 [Sphingobacteriales bacterium]|nr:MAG: hypothetical protein EOP49_10700 [Sphingobacteriales bacterium]